LRRDRRAALGLVGRRLPVHQARRRQPSRQAQGQLGLAADSWGAAAPACKEAGSLDWEPGARQHRHLLLERQRHQANQAAQQAQSRRVQGP
jgi:hypothetical protein